MKKFILFVVTFCFSFLILSELKSQNLISTHNVNNLSDLNLLSPEAGSIINVGNLGVYQYDGALWTSINGLLDTGGLANLESIIISYQDFIQDCNFCNPSYEVGDTLDCGIVVHTNTDGEHGLIMALDDQMNRNFGCNSDEYNTTNPSSFAFEKSDGLLNSMVINDSCSTSAASDCINYNPCNNGGWYLPAKNELTLMFINYPNINIVLSNLGKPLISSTDYYWSSSKELDYGFVNGQLTNAYTGIAGIVYDSSNWSNSKSDTLNKSSIRLVRPFKRF
jgi:hypothetical protein